MIAVIPYKSPRKHTHELRYSIRSLFKHFKPLTDVILVGDKPSWYIGKHIPFEDIKRRKEFSIYSKLMACGLREPVLYTNDDYFALQDFDETLPNYYYGLCGEKRPKDKIYRELYWNCPKEWRNFDIHCPMVIDLSKFPQWDIDRPIKTQYAHGLPGTDLSDCKIKMNLPLTEIKELIAGRPFFSTAETAIGDGMIKLFIELYPNASPVEQY